MVFLCDFDSDEWKHRQRHLRTGEWRGRNKRTGYEFVQRRDRLDRGWNRAMELDVHRRERRRKRKLFCANFTGDRRMRFVEWSKHDQSADGESLQQRHVVDGWRYRSLVVVVLRLERRRECVLFGSTAIWHERHHDG